MCIYLGKKKVCIVSVALKCGCEQLKTVGYKTHILGTLSNVLTP